MRTLIAAAAPDIRRMVFNREALAILESVSAVDWVPEGLPYTSADLARDIGGYDACITTWGSAKLTQEVLEKADRLKFVGHAAGTVIPIVDPAIFDRNIAVVNANGPLARSTAELAFSLILAGAWDHHGYNSRMKQGQWSINSRETVMGLYRQVVGIIGYGDISRELIRLMKPFDAEILLHSRNCSPEEASRHGVMLCGLEDLLRRSQIISLHNTLTPLSRGMLGHEQLRLIRDGALFVNTARGPIVDEKALAAELRTGRFFAALDVFDEEPLAPDHEFLRLPNVLCLPHIGGFSRHWKTRLGESVVRDLVRFLRGEPLHGEITREKFARLTPG